MQLKPHVPHFLSFIRKYIHRLTTFYSTTIAVVLLTASAVLAEELRIGTFNAEFLTRPKVHIKFGLPFDTKDFSAEQKAQWETPGFRDEKFAEATQAVAEAIQRFNADVWVLTEAGNATDVAELRAALEAIDSPFRHIAICKCTDYRTRQHVVVLSNFRLRAVVDAIPGRESYLKESDDANSEDDTGISKGLRVSFNAQGHRFHLYGLHLASEAGGSERDEQRIAQASLVRRDSLELLNDGEHVIVAGDLNDRRGEPAIRRIRGLDDIWTDLMQTGHTSYFENNMLDTRWTYQFEGMRQQIDHILLSRSINQISRKISSEVLDPQDDFVSDHRAIVVTIDLD